MMNSTIELYGGKELERQISGNIISLSTWPQCCYHALVPSPARLPRDFELWIEKVGSDIVLDYGAKLRLLIADPFKGQNLREAIAKLKEAL
jgi:hypothetical protein